jgi:hypothetical protein
MIMADILKIFLLVVGLLTVYVSYWLAAQALFPERVERMRHRYAQPIKITLVGLVAALPPVALGLILSQQPNPVLKILGITLMVIPALLGLVGSAGLALRIGAGLASPLDEQQPWRRVLRGGILLSLTFLLPIVGWVVLPIWALVSGLGAFILSLSPRVQTMNQPPPISLNPATGAA